MTFFARARASWKAGRAPAGKILRTVLLGFGVAAASPLGAALVYANYTATPGSGLTFGSIVLAGVNYAAQLICDPTAGVTQCAAVNSNGQVAIQAPPSLPLPANAAQENGGNLATAATNTGTTNTNLGAPGATACASDTGSCSLNALAQRIAQRLSTLIAFFTGGQAIPSASLSVVQASDTLTGGGSITAADSATTTTAGYNSVNYITGTPTANSAVSQSLNGIAGGTITVTNTFVGTLQFEISADGGTTYVVSSARQRGNGGTLGPSTTSTTGIGVFQLDLADITNVRVRATAWTSGTATVKFNLSSAPGTVNVQSPVRLMDNASNQQLTIKAASTAAVATDPSVVVQNSPNDPVMGAPGATACATDTGSCSFNALFQRIAQRLTSVITALGSPFQAGGSIGNTSFGAATSPVGTNPSSTLTLPSTTTAYSAGQLIASSATAGSVTNPSFSIANSAGAALIPRLRLSTNDTTSTAWGAQTIQVDLWTASPTWTNGDRGTFSPATGTGSHLGAYSCVMSSEFGDGAYGECAPSVGSAPLAKLASGTTIYWSLKATTGSGVTGASKVFTLVAEVLN
jgi:hypothetical protein